MEIAEQQQWQQAEEEEEVVAAEAEAVALQGRRPRHPNTAAAAATIGVSDASNGDVMVTSSEPANGFQDGEYREEELHNGNGGASKWSVYFDKDEGIWKCRNCFWTYQSGSQWVDHTQHPKWHLHMLMNVKTVNQQGQCFFCETKDTESTYGLSGRENSSAQGFSSEKIPGDDVLVVTENNSNNQKSPSTVINHQYKQNLKDDSFSGFKILPSEKSFEEHKTNKSISDKTVACDVTELIKESDQELTELDVERVLEKQDTHDLYCPNCNSCITRRVILRKRKHQIRIAGEDAKRNKMETVVASELDAISAHATNDQGHNAVDISLDGSLTPAANEYDRDREPEIFRCLSCFSFFIPTGNGFKMSNIFGDKREKQTMQNPQQISATKKNWFSSIFAPHKEDMLIVQGSGCKADVEEISVAASKQEVTSLPQSFGAQGIVKSSTAKPPECGDDIVPSSTQGSELIGKVTGNRGEKDDVMKKSTEGAAPYHPELDTVNQLNLSSFSNKMLLNHESDHPASQITQKSLVHNEEQAENAIFKPQQDGLKILVHSSTESITLEQSQTDQKLSVAIERKSADDKGSSVLLLPKPVSVLGELDINEKVNIVADLPSENGQNVGVKLPTKSIVEDKSVKVKTSGNDAAYPSGVSQHAIIGTKVDIHIEEPLKADTNSLSLSVQDVLLLPDRQINITKDLKDMPATNSAGSDTIIIIKEGPVQPAASQEARDIIASAETGPSPHTVSAEARGFQGLDVIKSVVYGGLIESITSLGIVLSAAGADAATLNILALGLANLIGGLFLVGQNLWELKNDHYEGASDQVTKQLDKYQELLGRRENFLLHATVAVLSFLICGLLPPVVYGFSFRESDNRDFKLIAVAIASLLCITVLATGKAYVQRPPKAYIKTVMHYVIIGFVTSGVSYAVGDLIKKLLEKLDWFNYGGLVLNLPILETTPMQPAWGSY